MKNISLFLVLIVYQILSLFSFFNCIPFRLYLTYVVMVCSLLRKGEYLDAGPALDYVPPKYLLNCILVMPRWV